MRNSLHNPYLFPPNRKFQDICYMGDVNKKYIEVIIKNPSINKEELESYCGKNIILMFYSRNGYHYTKMDTIKKILILFMET